jgi:hypothetical protein
MSWIAPSVAPSIELAIYGEHNRLTQELLRHPPAWPEALQEQSMDALAKALREEIKWWQT